MAGGSNVGTADGEQFYRSVNFMRTASNLCWGVNAQPAFNLSGGNLNGGQNAVQLAVSDAIPLQVFAANNTSTNSTTPWTLTPQNTGYGQGNLNLGTAGLGNIQSSGGLRIDGGVEHAGDGDESSNR